MILTEVLRQDSGITLTFNDLKGIYETYRIHELNEKNKWQEVTTPHEKGKDCHGHKQL